MASASLTEYEDFTTSEDFTEWVKKLASIAKWRFRIIANEDTSASVSALAVYNQLPESNKVDYYTALI